MPAGFTSTKIVDGNNIEAVVGIRFEISNRVGCPDDVTFFSEALVCALSAHLEPDCV